MQSENQGLWLFSSRVWALGTWLLGDILALTCALGHECAGKLRGGHSTWRGLCCGLGQWRIVGKCTQILAPWCKEKQHSRWVRKVGQDGPPGRQSRVHGGEPRSSRSPTLGEAGWARQCPSHRSSLALVGSSDFACRGLLYTGECWLDDQVRPKYYKLVWPLGKPV